MSEVKVIDNSQLYKDAKNAAVAAALEAIGITAERHAKEKCPVDMGRLRNSISHAVVESEEAVYIGTNVEYARYVETGTGIHADDGKGRKTPWRYKDSHGKWHMTKGSKPHHYLRDSVAKHPDEYKRIAEVQLQKASLL